MELWYHEEDINDMDLINHLTLIACFKSRSQPNKNLDSNARNSQISKIEIHLAHEFVLFEGTLSCTGLTTKASMPNSLNHL